MHISTKDPNNRSRISAWEPAQGFPQNNQLKLLAHRESVAQSTSILEALKTKINFQPVMNR